MRNHMSDHVWTSHDIGWREISPRPQRLEGYIPKRHTAMCAWWGHFTWYETLPVDFFTSHRKYSLTRTFLPKTGQAFLWTATAGHYRGRFGCQMSGQGKQYIVYKMQCRDTADPLPYFTCASLMRIRWCRCWLSEMAQGPEFAMLYSYFAAGVM